MSTSTFDFEDQHSRSQRESIDRYVENAVSYGVDANEYRAKLEERFTYGFSDSFSLEQFHRNAIATHAHKHGFDVSSTDLDRAIKNYAAKNALPYAEASGEMIRLGIIN